MHGDGAGVVVRLMVMAWYCVRIRAVGAAYHAGTGQTVLLKKIA
jgi:hypothetical protein